MTHLKQAMENAYMSRIFLSAAVAVGLAYPLAAQQMVSATLAGHAVLPSASFSAVPSDAPAEAWISGKFTTGPAPVRAAQSMMMNGIAHPFLGQPLQGFSGYAARRGDDGSLIALIDNGYGNKANSSDALLGFTRIMPDFDTRTVKVTERFWLRDPDGHTPFRITHETTEARYLTGEDFDLESIQIVGSTVWIGEEFGPYLISATLDGKITGVYPTLVNGVELKSPDHPSLRVPAEGGVDWRLPRSGGYEGLALSQDGKTLWAMLEKSLLVEGGETEGDFLRVLAFDPAAREWTGDSFKFALTEGAVAIGDFNFIDETRALVIERDGGEGHVSAACTETRTEDCHTKPALVKRVTLIDTAQIDAEGFVRRLSQIDLMDIHDPDGISRMNETSGDVGADKFVFPFVTIESVIRDGEEHILVSNDNNLPFSTGRTVGVADSNEIIRLHVPELLAVR